MPSVPEFPADGNFDFIIPGDPDYFTHYDEDSDEEFEAYLRSIALQPAMVMPSDIKLLEYTAKRGIGDLTGTIIKAQDIKIDGADYTVWYENRIDTDYYDVPGYFVSNGDASWNQLITFTK